MTMDLYAALDLPRDAPQEDIHPAYRKAAKRAHPDLGGSPEEFQAVTQAISVLSDPARRKRYDETGDPGADTADNAIAHAMQFVSAALDAVLNELVQTGRDPLQEAYLLTRVLKRLNNEIGNCESAITKSKTVLGRAEELRNRFSTKDGSPSRIQALIGARISGLKAEIESTEKKIASLTMAADIVKIHEFKADAPAPAPPPLESAAASAELLFSSFGGFGGSGARRG